MNDVRVALGASSVYHLSHMAMENERSVVKRKDLGTNTEMRGRAVQTIVNLSGLRRILNTFAKPSAKRFSGWLEDVVIPAIGDANKDVLQNTVGVLDERADFFCGESADIFMEEDNFGEGRNTVDKQQAARAPISTDMVTVNYDDARPTVSGRELHNALGIETRYNDWIARMLEYGFEENRDLNLLKNEQVQIEGGREVKRTIIDHILTLDCAKEICMLQRTEIGKRFRMYFLECEKKFWEERNNKRLAPKTTEDFLLEATEHLKALREQNARLEQEVAVAAPKVEFYDTVAESKDAFSMREVAAELNIPGLGQNNLFRFLKANNILTSDNLPYRRFINEGYFRVIVQKYNTPSGSPHVSMKTLVTQKGVDYILRVIKKAAYAKQSQTIQLTGGNNVER